MRYVGEPDNQPSAPSVPEWVTEGYGQDHHGRQLAADHYLLQRAKFDEKELRLVRRLAARIAELKALGKWTHPCRSCGKHAFGTPDVVCFWCRRAPSRTQEPDHA